MKNKIQKKIEKFLGKEIKPADMRMIVQMHLIKEKLSAGQFYRKHSTEINFNAKQRTFEQYVTGNKDVGAGCLVPVYEFITKKRIIRTGNTRIGYTYNVVDKEKFEEAFP